MRALLAFCWVASLCASLAMAQEAQTLKERLSDKASDAQRIDDCHVPPERRGPKLRPDCPGRPEAIPLRGGPDGSGSQSLR
jgi:hypothetical protein